MLFKALAFLEKIIAYVIITIQISGVILESPQHDVDAIDLSVLVQWGILLFIR